MYQFFYNNDDVVDGLNKYEFKNPPSLATQESYLILNEAFHK